MRAISKYYGTLTSDKGISTCAGHRWINAAAQTHDGSVVVEIVDGRVGIYVHKGSDIKSANGRELLLIPLEKLVRAGALAIKKEKVALCI